jgi:predicted phage-related endonuclease
MITDEQLKFKQGRIGASQFAQAIGRGYGSSTRANLFHRLKGTLPPIEETMAMRVGNYMEAFVLSEYERVTGRKGVEYPETQIHPDDDRIICHCDGITEDGSRLIEIKNVGHRMLPKWEQGVPEYYWVQCCGQSMLTGIKKVDVAAYFGGNELRIYELEFTDEDHSLLYDALKDFLGYLDRDEEPPHIVADLPNLDKYYDVNKGSSVAGSKEVIAMANRLAGMKKHLKPDPGMKENMEAWEFAIKEYMKDNDTLVDENGEVIWTWKKAKDKPVVDWEGMAKEMLTAYNQSTTDEYMEKYTTVKPGNRTFLCKIKD